jgi:hypothetical protein
MDKPLDKATSIVVYYDVLAGIFKKWLPFNRFVTGTYAPVLVMLPLIIIFNSIFYGVDVGNFPFKQKEIIDPFWKYLFASMCELICAVFVLYMRQYYFDGIDRKLLQGQVRWSQDPMEEKREKAGFIEGYHQAMQDMFGHWYRDDDEKIRPTERAGGKRYWSYGAAQILFTFFFVWVAWLFRDPSISTHILSQVLFLFCFWAPIVYAMRVLWLSRNVIETYWKWPLHSPAGRFGNSGVDFFISGWSRVVVIFASFWLPFWLFSWQVFTKDIQAIAFLAMLAVALVLFWSVNHSSRLNQLVGKLREDDEARSVQGLRSKYPSVINAEPWEQYEYLDNILRVHNLILALHSTNNKKLLWLMVFVSIWVILVPALRLAFALAGLI